MSPDGRDTNPGTHDAPFATLARARDALRKRSHSGATVVVGGGTYHMPSTLDLDARDSHTRWTVADGETATLSGGIPIDAARFSPYRGDILVADMRADKLSPGLVNQLFADGVRLVRARYPNGNPQTGRGICFSKSQRDNERCDEWLTPAVKQDGRRQDPGLKDFSLSLPLNRGDSPTLGCTECVQGPQTFHYDIFSPPAGHPVYDNPDATPVVPGWKNRSVLSLWGSIFDRPGAVTVNQSTWTDKNWKHPETAVVHMFHGRLWGGWQFQVKALERPHKGPSLLTFEYGGFQEGRGASVSQSSRFYVENVFEELDAPGEWFYDEAAQKLYVYPNISSTTTAAYVVPALNTLVRISGGAQSVSFSGFELTETRATFMEQYEVPSGGDWSVHRGAAVELVDGVQNCSVSGNYFNQVGGNGLLLGQGVSGATVSNNEFQYTGDSGIVSLGATSGWNGTDPTMYPHDNFILHNHFHEYGVYGKQSSCFFQALTATSTVSDNVCYNGPRAGFNYNDGFFGGYEMSRNLLFNHVRETGDHGPFNSWDRQPYFTLNGIDDGFDPATTKGYPPGIPKGAAFLARQNHIQDNFILNGYNGVWSIDHDDGSQFYNDTHNVMIFGGCKNFLGNSKSCGRNFILFPGLASRASGNRRCQTDDNGVFANQFFHENTCFVADGLFYTFEKCTNANLATTVYETAHNTFYSYGNATFQAPCGGVADGLDAWQKLGQDSGSTVAKAPGVDRILQMANETLVW